jgi:hypothetical protein
VHLIADGTPPGSSGWIEVVPYAVTALFMLFGTVNLVLLVRGERPKIAQYASEFLEPGEQIQASFKAFKRRGNGQYLYGIVATDREIIVLNFAVRHAGPPHRMSMRQPRNVYFQPRRHSWPWRSAINLGGQRLTVPRRFLKDVRAADEALAEMNRAA